MKLIDTAIRCGNKLKFMAICNEDKLWFCAGGGLLALAIFSAAKAGKKCDDILTRHNEKMEEKKVNTGARDCFLETLKKLGCQYEIDKEDDRIQFAFQGENFVAEATNEGCYVHLWDTFWGQVELCDIDEFTRLRKAINTSNINCTTTTVYSINEAGSSVDVHSKKSILFLPQIPQVENYLRSELGDFFRAHQIVGYEMAKMRENEEAIESNT